MKQPKLLILGLIKSQTKNMYHQDKILLAVCPHPLDHLISALDKDSHLISFILVKSISIIIAIMMNIKQLIIELLKTMIVMMMLEKSISLKNNKIKRAIRIQIAMLNTKTCLIQSKLASMLILCQQHQQVGKIQSIISHHTSINSLNPQQVALEEDQVSTHHHETHLI